MSKREEEESNRKKTIKTVEHDEELDIGIKRSMTAQMEDKALADAEEA